MKIYPIAASEYYAKVGVLLEESENRIAQVEGAMKGLIDRYSLHDTRVLSFGAGFASEEYWLWQAGCDLTLLDIRDDIEAFVSGLAKVRPASSFTFVFEDAGNFVEQYPKADFDILFMSGFHPDEMRRGAIQEAFCATRSQSDAASYITWPAGENPYHDIVVRGFYLLKPGGLIVIQHYRNGVYIDSNSHYLDDVVHQFQEYGVTLLEVYCFRKSPPHTLVVARRDNDLDTDQIMSELDRRPLIKTFHARYPDEAIRTDVIRAYACDQAQVTAGAFVPPRPQPGMPTNFLSSALGRIRQWLRYTGCAALPLIEDAFSIFGPSLVA